jgi:hypothetical protein
MSANSRQRRVTPRKVNVTRDRRERRTLFIGGAMGLGVLAATFASVWRSTDDRERLRLDRLAALRNS